MSWESDEHGEWPDADELDIEGMDLTPPQIIAVRKSGVPPQKPGTFLHASFQVYPKGTSIWWYPAQLRRLCFPGRSKKKGCDLPMERVLKVYMSALGFGVDAAHRIRED
jgi:hypothetical protein